MGVRRVSHWLFGGACPRAALVAALAVIAGVAGGPASAAQAPGGNPIPRELSGTWHILAGDRTLPGNFQNPAAVAVDPQGDVYVADTQNFRIEKLSPTGQVLAVIGDLGMDRGEFLFPQGIAVDRKGNIYVADTGNARIEKFSPRGFPLAVWNQVGGAPGEFAYPDDVAVDRAGDVYVSDWWDHRVQKLSPEGKPLEAWGAAHPMNGSLQLIRPAGVAVDSAGTLYISDYSLGRIVKISPQGRVAAIWGGAKGSGQEFLQPEHLAVDGAGNLYVADRGHHRVVELSPTGREVRAWSLGAKGDPNGVAVTPAGTIVVADTRGSRVLQYSPNGKTLLTAWGHDERATGEFFFPTAVAVGPSGMLAVADMENARIEQVSTAAATSSPRVIWSLPRITAKRIGKPTSIAIDPAGDTYVVDARQKGVAKLLPDGRPVPHWPANPRALPADPIGVAADPAGGAYVVDGASSQIWRLDAAGHLLSRWGKGPGKSPGQFRFDRTGPAGIAADGQGHVYVTDTKNSRIEKFTANGRLLAVWSKTGYFFGGFSYPYGVAVDTRGNVYVADTYANAIEELSPSGAPIARWGTQGSAPGQFRDPFGIAVDSSGVIYVADSNNDRIQAYTALTSAAPVAPVRVSGPAPFAACKPVNPTATQPTREGETRLAINPATVGSSHVNLIGVWTQGGALAVVAGYSNDGGASWQETPLPFSRCVPGGLPFSQTGDPWVSIGPDSTAYVVGLGDTWTKHGKKYGIVADGIEVATSADGGRSWSNVRVVSERVSPGALQIIDDKPTVVADPIHPGVAYVFWDSLSQKQGYTGWLVKTTDGGKTWSQPTAFLPPQPYSVAALHQPLIDPRSGTIYDVFSYERGYPTYVWRCKKINGNKLCKLARSLEGTYYLASVRSTDAGKTWSAPRIIAGRSYQGLPDIFFGADIRTGVGLDAALDPATGRLNVVWADATFTEGNYDQVLFSSSADGGASWTQPVRVTQLPAFDPTVAVNAAGTVAVTYYAVRRARTPHTFHLPKRRNAQVTYMMQTSSDGGVTFSDPRPVFGRFNADQAVHLGTQLFVGDYEGLASDGLAFHPFFVAGNAGDKSDPVDVYTGAVQP
jgi:sugar lactone lactonase YvrE